MLNIKQRSYSKSEKPKEKNKIELIDIDYVYEEDAKINKVLLGKGSFATVYLVKHKRTKKLFALKVVL